MKKNSFRSAILITWGIIILCLTAIGMMIKIYLIDYNFSHDWDFLVYSIPLLIPSVVFIMLLYDLRRTYADQQAGIKEGNYLVHWEYGEEQWRRFNLIEWRKSRKRAVIIPLGFLFLFFIAGLLDKKSSFEVLVIAAPYLILFFGALSIVLLFYTYALYKRTWTCPREVFISLNGFLYGGYYNSWSHIGTRLTGVELIHGEMTALQFNIEVWGKGGYNKRPVRIPVPEGSINEAEKVIMELKKESVSVQNI